MSYLPIFAILSVFLMHKSLCVEESEKSKISSYENENSVPGRYHFKFETSDGTYREETIVITNPESDDAVLVIRGVYSYLSPDGQKYTVRYVADDQGFRPEINRVIVSPETINTIVRIGGDAVSSLQGGGLG